MRWDEIDARTIVVPRGTPHIDQLFREMSPEQQARTPVLVLQNREARLAFVTAGVGATWIEHSMIENAVARGARVYVMEPPLPVAYGLVYDAEALSPAAQAFAEVAAEVAAAES